VEDSVGRGKVSSGGFSRQGEDFQRRIQQAEGRFPEDDPTGEGKVSSGESS